MPDHRYPPVVSLMNLSDEDMWTIWHALVVMRDAKTQPLDMIRRADTLIKRIHRAAIVSRTRREHG